MYSTALQINLPWDTAPWWTEYCGSDKKENMAAADKDKKSRQLVAAVLPHTEHQKIDCKIYYMRII